MTALSALFPALEADEALARAVLEVSLGDPNEGVRSAAEAAAERLFPKRGA